MSLARALLATAVLAACALGWAVRADASPAQLTKAEGMALDQAVSPDSRDGGVDRSSIVDVAPKRASESSRAGASSTDSGRAGAALLAAFLLAGVVAVLVAAASRVRSSWPA
jgi:hypothetical protein